MKAWMRALACSEVSDFAESSRSRWMPSAKRSVAAAFKSFERHQGRGLVAADLLREVARGREAVGVVGHRALADLRDRADGGHLFGELNRPGEKIAIYQTIDQTEFQCHGSFDDLGPGNDEFGGFGNGEADESREAARFPRRRRHGDAEVGFGQADLCVL